MSAIDASDFVAARRDALEALLTDARVSAAGRDDAASPGSAITRLRRCQRRRAAGAKKWCKLPRKALAKRYALVGRGRYVWMARRFIMVRPGASTGPRGAPSALKEKTGRGKKTTKGLTAGKFAIVRTRVGRRNVKAMRGTENASSGATQNAADAPINPIPSPAPTPTPLASRRRIARPVARSVHTHAVVYDASAADAVIAVANLSSSALARLTTPHRPPSRSADHASAPFARHCLLYHVDDRVDDARGHAGPGTTPPTSQSTSVTPSSPPFAPSVISPATVLRGIDREVSRVLSTSAQGAHAGDGGSGRGNAKGAGAAAVTDAAVLIVPAAAAAAVARAVRRLGGGVVASSVAVAGETTAAVGVHPALFYLKGAGAAAYVGAYPVVPGGSGDGARTNEKKQGTDAGVDAEQAARQFMAATATTVGAPDDSISAIVTAGPECVWRWRFDDVAAVLDWRASEGARAGRVYRWWSETAHRLLVVGYYEFWRAVLWSGPLPGNGRGEERAIAPHRFPPHTYIGAEGVGFDALPAVRCEGRVAVRYGVGAGSGAANDGVYVRVLVRPTARGAFADGGHLVVGDINRGGVRVVGGVVAHSWDTTRGGPVAVGYIGAADAGAPVVRYYRAGALFDVRVQRC